LTGIPGVWELSGQVGFFPSLVFSGPALLLAGSPGSINLSPSTILPSICLPPLHRSLLSLLFLSFPVLVDRVSFAFPVASSRLRLCPSFLCNVIFLSTFHGCVHWLFFQIRVLLQLVEGLFSCRSYRPIPAVPGKGPVFGIHPVWILFFLLRELLSCNKMGWLFFRIDVRLTFFS